MLIDTKPPLNHDKLFVQALQELEQGASFFLTLEQEAEMRFHNEQRP